MIKKPTKLWTLWIVSLLLSGCWDYEDVEKRSIVVGIGVERVKDNIEFSTEIAKLTEEIGAKKEEAEIANVYNDLSYGKTFEEARVDYDSKRPYTTFLGATRVVIFGPNYAKEGIEGYLNRINKIPDYRKTLLAVVSRESPRELFNTKIENDISVGFLIEDNINFLANRGGAIYPTIGELLSDIALGEVGYVLPYIGIEQGSPVYLGLAVMKDSKIVGTIDKEDTKGILYILSDKPILMQVMPSLHNDKNQLSFKITIKKRKIKTSYMDDKVTIHIDLDLKAELQYQYDPEPISDEDIKEFENMLSQNVKKDMEAIIEKTQKEYECDIFGFARYFRADYPKIYNQMKWSEEYPHANMDISVKTKIVNQYLSDSNATKKY